MLFIDNKKKEKKIKKKEKKKLDDKKKKLTLIFFFSLTFPFCFHMFSLELMYMISAVWSNPLNGVAALEVYAPRLGKYSQSPTTRSYFI